MAFPERRLEIFDTTLRDGNQAPGCAFTVAQKLEIAHLLDDAGLDIIERPVFLFLPGLTLRRAVSLLRQVYARALPS